MKPIEVVSALITPAEDIHGVWVAHCLDYDIAVRGDAGKGINSAADALCEAVELALRCDRDRGDRAGRRNKAPSEDWETFAHTILHGAYPEELGAEMCVCATHMRIIADANPPFTTTEIQDTRVGTGPGHD